MKKLSLCLAILMLLVCFFTLTACGDDTIVIGIMQFGEIDALVAAKDGFVEGLKEAGYVDGENIKIVYQNANFDPSNCATIATTFKSQQMDLILAIATPAAQAAATKITDIPILITAVTDPAKSSIVADNNKPGANVTGTSDLNYVEAQIKLIKLIKPEAKTVGLLYSDSETNSALQIALAKEVCVTEGLSFIEATVSSSNDIATVCNAKFKGKVDALFLPTDNLISAGVETVVATLPDIPIVAGEGGMLPQGALITYSFSYFDLGKTTAAMAVKILKGEATPATMPIEYSNAYTLEVNQTVADKLGITIPADLQQRLEATLPTLDK